MSSTFTITPLIASHANTSQTYWYTVLYLYSRLGFRVPFFIPLQSINDIAHTCLPAIHCIDSIYAPISCVPLSDKATNQIPHNFPSVMLVLGATALRMGKKPCGLSPTNTMLILLPEVMKTPGGWHEGRKHHCTVAPSSRPQQQHAAAAEVPLPLDSSPPLPPQALPNLLSVASRVVKHFHVQQSQNCNPCSV
jgi:hypothetical protein